MGFASTHSVLGAANDKFKMVSALSWTTWKILQRCWLGFGTAIASGGVFPPSETDFAWT